MEKYKTGEFCNGTCNVPAEAQAVACTELPDSALKEDFRMFCNKWLPKRYFLMQN